MNDSTVDRSPYGLPRSLLLKDSGAALRERVTLAATVLVFGWFLFQVIYFAYHIPYGIAPDEIFHTRLSTVWSRNLMGFNDNPETYMFGPVSRHPYFYHLLMGGILRISPPGIAAENTLRVVNIVISSATFWAAWGFLKAIKLPSFARMAVLLLSSNLLMYVFISGVVSYDPLVFFLATLASFFLARLVEKRDLGTALALGITIGLGNITKISFGPFAVLAALATLLICRQHLVTAKYWSQLRHPKVLLQAVVLLVVAAFNVSLYGANIVKHGQIFPKCPNIIGHEGCQANPEYRRDVDMHAENGNLVRGGFTAYLRDYFRVTDYLAPGIMAHRSMNPTSKWERYPHRLFAACLILGLLVRLGMPGRRQFFLNDRFWPFALVAFGYCACIIYEHYLGYLRFGDIRPGLQFRYHFPVLFPFLYVFAFTVCGDNPKTFSRITLLIICLFSFANGFLFFKRHDSEDWYRRHQNSLRESSRAHLVPHSAVVQTNVFHRSQS